MFDRCNLPLQNNAEGNCVANTLKNCTSLQSIHIVNCEVSDQQLIPMVEAIGGHHSLKKLDLSDNRIGTAGCKALALLLEDPNSKLCELDLYNNNIGHW